MVVTWYLAVFLCRGEVKGNGSLDKSLALELIHHLAHKVVNVNEAQEEETFAFSRFQIVEPSSWLGFSRKMFETHIGRIYF
jgi:hypothetical protein